MKNITSLKNLKYFIPLVLLFFSPISASIHLAPKIRNKPADLLYEVGTTGNTLTWVFEAEETADDPSFYSATLNGAPIAGHTLAPWSDLIPVVVNVDGLDLGSYIVTVKVNDSGTDALQASSSFDSANVEVVVEIASATTTTSSSPTTTTSSSPTTTTSSSTPLTTTTSSTASQTTTSESPPDTTTSGSLNVTGTDSTSEASLPIPLFSVLFSLLSLGILTWRRRI